jgi:hypothetical protein
MKTVDLKIKNIINMKSLIASIKAKALMKALDEIENKKDFFTYEDTLHIQVMDNNLQAIFANCSSTHIS